MPKFSVIVPIYKVEAYLRTCIESVLNQNYDDFELILVDDGSPDNCPSICDEYAEKDKRVRVVHKENGGLVSARIAGAKEARGEYVCCVDGDDWVSSDYFKILLPVVQEYNPDVVCFGFYCAYDDVNVPPVEKKLPYRLGYYSRHNIENEIFPLLVQDVYNRYFSPNVWSKVFKRELYVQEQLLIHPQIKIGEDIACTTSCVYRAETMYILSDCLYYYRQNVSAMTKEKKAFDWMGPKLIFVHQMNRIDLNAFDFREQMYRSIVHLLFNVAVSQFYRKENYKTIINDLKTHLSDACYEEAILNCKFCSLKGRFAAFALKYHLYGLMWLYSKVK